MSNVDPDDLGAALGAFVQQFYSGSSAVPSEVLLSHPVEEPEVLRQWLSQKRGTRVELNNPQRGQEVAADPAGPGQRPRDAEGRCPGLRRAPAPGEAALHGRRPQHRGRPGPVGRGPGPARTPAAHRRLRHLPLPGQPDRGQHGGDDRRPPGAQRVPQIQDQDRGGRGRFRQHGRGGGPPLQAGPGRGPAPARPGDDRRRQGPAERGHEGRAGLRAGR